MGNLKLSERGLADADLGCEHDEEGKTLLGGAKVKYLEYNMEEYLRSCTARYEEQCAGPMKWKSVDTPYLDGSVEGDPFRHPVCKGPGLQCPHCDDIIPSDSSVW